MKRLFVVVMAFLMMQAFVCVWAKDMSQDNVLSSAIAEICDTPSDIESLSFSVCSSNRYRYLWEDYTYFTDDADTIGKALTFLSKVECSSETKNGPISGGCFATLKIVKKNGSVFELGYHDVDVLLYKGEYYGGSLDAFAEGLYDIRSTANGDSCIFPHDSKDSYTIDLSRKDVERIAYTVRDAEGTEKITAVENDTDNVSRISYSARTLELTYDGVTSEIPTNASKLVISYDDGKNDIFYIDKGNIEGNKVTNGRLWYNGSEYVLNADLFDVFENNFFETAQKDSCMIETENVLSCPVSEDMEITAIGYERYPKKEGENKGYYKFFSAVKEKEYIERIVARLEKANVVSPDKNKPFIGNKYYTEVINIQYSDGTICKIDIDGNKMLVDGEEYRVYGLSGVDEIALEAERKKRPAFEYEVQIYGMWVESKILKLDGNTWYNGRPYGVSGEVVQESVVFDVGDIDIENYILWLINSDAEPYDEDVMGEILHSRDVGTSFTVGFSNGSEDGSITIGFCSAKRVLLMVSYGCLDAVTDYYMLPYDKAVKIAEVIMDASDGTLESVKDIEAETNKLIEKFYSKSEKIENIILSEFITDNLDEIYKIRYIDCEYTDGEISEHKIYGIEGISVCAEVVKELEKVQIKKTDEAAFSDGTSYTILHFTNWKGYTNLLVFANGILEYRDEYYTYNTAELEALGEFLDSFEKKTVEDPYDDGMKDTALSKDMEILCANPGSVDKVVFSVDDGFTARSREQAYFDFYYETTDPEYIVKILEALSGCSISKGLKVLIPAEYPTATLKFETKNGEYVITAVSEGGISYRGSTYYSDITEFCKAIYEFRADQAENSLLFGKKSGYVQMDPFANNTVKYTLKHKDFEVSVSDKDAISNISVFARNWISLEKSDIEYDADGREYELVAEYADGEKGSICFYASGADIIVRGSGNVYTVYNTDTFTRFIRFFEFYAKSDNIKISLWAKPELEKAVSYGFCGIGDFSDDYSKKLTRLEVCDILVYPVNDIIGISTACIEPSYSDVYSQSVYDLTSVGAVEGKDAIMIDGAVWKRIFAPDDLVTREELAKIVCGIYRGGDYEYFSGYKADFELPEVTKTSFNDDGDISDWAKPYVEMAKNLGIFKGDDLGNFNPKANCTKEEVVAVAVRLYDMMLERTE